MPTIMQRLRDLADHSFQHTTRPLLESGQSLLPVVLALMQDGGLAVIGVEYHEDETKVRAYHTLGQRLYRKGVLGVVAINDTWMSRADPGLPLGLLRPRHDPDRSEAVVLSLKTRSGEQEVWVHRYDRRPDGIRWAEREVWREVSVILLRTFGPARR